jgi:hypothetical protein
MTASNTDVSQKKKKEKGKTAPQVPSEKESRGMDGVD